MTAPTICRCANEQNSDEVICQGRRSRHGQPGVLRLLGSGTGAVSPELALLTSSRAVTMEGRSTTSSAAQTRAISGTAKISTAPFARQTTAKCLQGLMGSWLASHPEVSTYIVHAVIRDVDDESAMISSSVRFPPRSARGASFTSPTSPDTACMSICALCLSTASPDDEQG